MGGRDFGLWTALAVKQNLDTTGNRKIIAYLGNGRLSAPGNNLPTVRQGILVANAEYFQRFHPRFMFSTALSYRFHNEYRDPPHGAGETSLRQEYRFYARLYYLLETRRMQFALVFRQEFRLFSTVDFVLSNEVLQPRSRFRAELAAYLDSKLKHRFTFRAEQLFSFSIFTNRSPRPFQLRDTRVSAYYSLCLPKMTISLGAIQLINVGLPRSGVNVGVDVTLRDPFKISSKARTPPKRIFPGAKDDWESGE